MRIILIGSGNVATVLGRKLRNAGHSIAQVYSRHRAHAQLLSAQLEAEAVSSPKEIAPGADIYLVAISDDELFALHEWMVIAAKAMVVHTAGSVEMAVLQKISSNYGVFYPLQTLRKDIEVAGDIPLLIDANSERGRQQLLMLAETISGNVSCADDDTRKKLHLAAVIVNNFSNHLYALAEDYCCSEGVDFKMLLPLIIEGAERIRQHSPSLLQTGPAIRHDHATIEEHQELLRAHAPLLKLYELFTASIEKFNRSK